MASLGRFITKVPKNALKTTRPMGTQPSHAHDNTGGAAPLASGGLNFTLTETQHEYLELAEKFTKDEIIPNAPHYDRTGEYPWEVIKKAHEVGLMNLHIPEEYGGMGMGTLDGCLITEKMAYGCTGIMTALEANGLGSMPIMIAGKSKIISSDNIADDKDIHGFDHDKMDKIRFFKAKIKSHKIFVK